MTLTCFSDILGNRLDLYDSIGWFDDAIHFVAPGLVSAAAILLTMTSPSLFRLMVERAIAVGMTASLGWELFEYVSFLTRSSELPTAYADTLGDLTLGWAGSLVAAVVVATAWRAEARRRAGRTPVS